MPTLSDISKHILNVKQTRKITNAMYLIASSRMRKALANIDQNRAYYTRAIETMREIRARIDIQHPYLTHRTGTSGNTAYIVISGEKGLSGSYNHDVLQMADESIEKHRATHVFTVGAMASAHFKRAGVQVNESFEHVAQTPSINTARRMTHIIMELYDSGEIDELRIVYTRFLSPAVHAPVDVEILPIELESGEREWALENWEKRTDFILYEPAPDELFLGLVPQFIIGYIYGALVHSHASENFSRMAAMEGATKSADELIAKLTKQYHSARQLAITNEISEIVNGANALSEG